MPDDPFLRHAPTEVHGRYFVRPPRAGSAGLWLVGFHGQDHTADAFLEQLVGIPGAEAWLLASIQGLNRYYTRRTRAIVAGWMTSQDRELVIADNVKWVDTALDHIEREFGAPRVTVFIGFSQGVAMAYRAGVLGRRECNAIVALNGDVPPELQASPAGEWPRVSAATGSGDEWYTPQRLASEVQLLRKRGIDARERVFDGGHEWTHDLARDVGRWLVEIAPKQ